MKTGLLSVLTTLMWLGCIYFSLAQPSAGFTVIYPSSTCNPSTVSLLNTSFSDTSLSYTWQFGIGASTDTSTNPLFTYDSCGFFTVTLTATDANGLTDTTSQTVNIACSPIASFSMSTNVVCDSATVEFTNLSLPIDSIVLWLWDFGDSTSGSANISTEANPTHYYDSSGIFSVSLIVTTTHGCNDTQSQSIMVFELTPTFTIADSACEKDSTQFSDLTFPEDSVVAWSWNFDDAASGNANESNLQNPIHIFNQPGDYNVGMLITTENGCSELVNKTITVHEAPEVYAGSDQQICSLDTVQLQGSGALSYQWSPAPFLSSVSAPDPLAFPIITTNFFLTGIDSIGCKATDSILISVIPFPPADAGTDTTICAGTSATLHGSGGILYSWSPSEDLNNDSISDPNASPAVSSTYILMVTDGAGCKSSDTVTVFVTSLPVVEILALNDQYCITAAPVALSGSPGGGNFSGDGVSGNTFYPSMLAAGASYFITYTYTDLVGCTGVDTSHFIILPEPDILFSTIDSTICKNSSPISFTLSPGNGLLFGPGVSNNLFDPSLVATAGTYNIFYTVTDSAGCINTDTLAINVLPLPFVNAGSDTTICGGDSLQLNGVGGIAYLWQPDSFLSNAQIDDPIAFPSSSIEYTVTAIDANGCSNSDSVFITVLLSVNLDAGTDVTICTGDTALLQATGGSNYVWSPSAGLSNPTIENPKAFPLQTTMYTLTVNSGSECADIDSVLVTVLPLPNVSTGNNSTLCLGDSVGLIADGAATYFWEPSVFLSNNIIPDPIAFPSVTTIFTVVGTDMNGCSNSDSVMLMIIPLPAIEANADTAICGGDSLQLLASGGLSYTWIPATTLSNDSIPNPIAFPDTSTVYEVIGTDAFGCSNTDSIQLVVLSVSVIDAGNDTSICLGDSIMLLASGGFNYLWSPAVGLSDIAIENPMASPLNTIVYTVTVGVGSPCQFSDSIEITVLELPVIIATDDSLVCPGDSIQLLATGALIYQWNPSVSLNNSQISNPLAIPTSSTTYTVTGTDIYGCKNTSSVTLSLLPAPPANAGSDTSICAGDSLVLHATGGNSFMWTPAGSLDNPMIPDPTAFPLSTTEYVVIITDGGVCAGLDTVKVIVNALPSADAGIDQFICGGSTVQLNSSGGIQYLWSPIEGLSSANISNPIATIDSAITYVVLVTDQNFCSASDSVHLEIAPPLSASINGDTSICYGTTAQLSGNGGIIYSWSPAEFLNDAAIAGPVASPDSTTTFSLIVADSVCYADTLVVTVFVSKPTVNAGGDAVSDGEAYQLLATASMGTYEWFPSTSLSCVECLNPIATPVQTTNYTITVTDSIGCIATDEVIISVGCSEEDLFIPNAFTPDNNGHNDLLLVRSSGTFHLNYFRIFDRWGKIIFETNDIGTAWDGSHKNKPLSHGVFLYLLEAECAGGILVRKEGNITLLR